MSEHCALKVKNKFCATNNGEKENQTFSLNECLRILFNDVF